MFHHFTSLISDLFFFKIFETTSFSCSIIDVKSWEFFLLLLFFKLLLIIDRYTIPFETLWVFLIATLHRATFNSASTQDFLRSSSSALTHPVETSVMCWYYTSDCPGVRIPGEAPLWCLGNVYVFNVDYCENPDSGDCIRTYHPDPGGNPDQCITCARTQLAIYPEGFRTSRSDRKVHVMKHPAPTYAPPPYVRPPEYEYSTDLHAPRTAGMFLITQPRHKTRSPPIGVNLSEWNFEEPAPQGNSNSDNGRLYEPSRTPVAQFNRAHYAIDAREDLGNSRYVHQSSIARARQASANDAVPPMENQRSLSVRQWAHRTGESNGRQENEQRSRQQRYYAFPQGGSSRNGLRAIQQNSTSGYFTLRRQITQTETASHQAQVLYRSLLDPARISVVPKGQLTAVMAGGQSINHGPLIAASVVRPTTPMSDRAVSEFLRRTRQYRPGPSEQRSQPHQ